MLDFDAGKLLIIGLVALVVIGPKDLPGVLRQVGQAVGKLRRMAGEFQGQFMDAMKEADFQDLKSEITKIKDSATLDIDFDPARDIKDHITTAVNETAPQTAAVAEPARLPGIGELPLFSPAEGSVEPLLAATGIGPVADVAVLEREPVTATAPADPDADAANQLQPTGEAPAMADEHRGARRKIVVTRRRRLSRLDGPTLRAALSGRSRNILPARRDNKDQ